MTPFEQQVAEALKSLVILGHRLDDPLTFTARQVALLGLIAPRVAAAIEATAHAGDFEGIADARMEAGLKTLQGRDPMEAET